MNEKVIENEKGEEVKLSFPDTPIEVDFSLGQGVWFYLPNSLEVQHGRVVGFFLLMEDAKDDGKRTYVYQIEYFKETKDKKTEMRLGTASAEEMSTEEKEIKKKFEKIRKTRIEAFIMQGKIELGGARAQKEEHERNEKEIAKEIKRLESLKR